MPDENLYGSSGEYLGRMSDDGSKIYLYGPAGEYLGCYDKSSNTTYDSSGGYVGQGNLLAMLLRK